MPTINQTVLSRGTIAQPSGNLYGREATWYSQQIALLEPWRTPMASMLMSAPTQVVNTVDYHWFDDETLPYADLANGTVGNSASSTTITVDTVALFRAGDLVKVNNTEEVVLVTSISGSVLTVTRNFGQGTEGWTTKLAEIPDNAPLTILGSAFEQGHPTPAFRGTREAEKINYIQDQRDAVKITEALLKTASRAEDFEAYEWRKKSIEHLNAIERTLIDARPYRSDLGAYVAATGNTAPSVCGGINYWITENAPTANVVDQTDLTEFEFLDFMEAAMDKGSKEKVLLCSSALRTAFSKWGILKEQTVENTNVLGMNVTKWQSSDGMLYIVTHDYLKKAATETWHRAYVLDLANIQMVYFGSDGATQRIPINYRTSGNGETVVGGELQTQFGLIVRLPATHARLRFQTYTA